MQRRLLTLENALACGAIQDGDLLLFPRRSLISIAGRGEHGHAARLGFVHGIPFCLELREFKGGRAVTLASQLAGGSLIDVYRPNPDNRWPEYDRVAAVRAMWLKCGKRYNYRGILWAALLHLPVVRCFVRPDTNDASSTDQCLPEFCSQACADADRVHGGVDPVPGLHDRLTEPADLARSSFYRYSLSLYRCQPSEGAS